MQNNEKKRYIIKQIEKNTIEKQEKGEDMNYLAIKAGIDFLILLLLFNYFLGIDSSLGIFLVGCSGFSFGMSATLLFRKIRQYGELLNEDKELDNQLTLTK